MNIITFLDAYLARESAEQGQEDVAIQQWRDLAEEMIGAGNYANVDLPLMFLAETLISRGDYDEAAVELERLAATAADRKWKSREISVLRLRSLLAQAQGDEEAYRELRDRYREMANELGFEGHMKWAGQMP